MMNGRLMWIAVLWLGIAGRAIAEDLQQTLCLGNAPDPDKAPAARALYDAWCPTYLAALPEKLAGAEREARSDAIRTDRQADFDVAATMAEKLKPADPKAPDLAGFVSAGQRHLADLAFATGGATSLAMASNAGTSALADAKVLVVADAATAALWFDRVDADETAREVETALDDAKGVASLNCPLVEGAKAPVLEMAPLVGLETLIAAANGVASLAQTLQPQVLGSKAVQVPENLTAAYLAGLQCPTSTANCPPRNWTFVVTPPAVADSTTVRGRAAEAGKAIEAATAGIAAWKADAKKKKREVEPACLRQATTKLTGATNRLKRQVTVEPGSPYGTRVEQAARQQARVAAGINYLLQTDVVVAGGGISSYRAHWFTGVKLASAADFSVVTKLFEANGHLLFLGYESRGCGRTVPIGEFTQAYAGTCGAGK